MSHFQPKAQEREAGVASLQAREDEPRACRVIRPNTSQVTYSLGALCDPGRLGPLKTLPYNGGGGRWEALKTADSSAHIGRRHRRVSHMRE